MVLIKRGLFLTICLLTLISSQTIAQSKALQSIKSKLKKGLVFKATLKHTFIDSFTGDTLINSGLVWIHQNGYRIEMDERVIAVFDDKSTVYNSIKDQVIFSNYSREDDDFAPSRFINANDEEYSVSEKKFENRWSVELVSKDDFAMFTQIIIDLDKQSKPSRITAFDQNSNVNISSFLNAELLPFKQDMKQIMYPKSAEIIDLRK